MLEFLFGPRNPTRSWPPDRAAPLTFDLDAASINAVGLGQQLTCLSFLGRDEGFESLRTGELAWFSKGLSVRFSPRSHCIVEYRIVHSDPLEPRFQQFCGNIIINGREVEFPTLSAEWFISECGNCFWRDRDESESILFYEFVGLEWQVEFDLCSRIRCITTTSEPIMANERQRLAYRVTEQWPPRRDSTCQAARHKSANPSGGWGGT